MAWFSILPPSLTGLETWLIQFFLLLGIITIGPWLIFLVYDFVLYVYRTIAYEIPVVGGRAQGSTQRPRAPSLSERPSGKSRAAFGVVGLGDEGEGEGDGDGGGQGGEVGEKS